MERHSIDEERALQMIRDQARRSHTLLVDAAQLVIVSGRVLQTSASASELR